MSLSALARQLHEAGTPIEGIILALEAVEEREREASERRAKAAARKQAQRDRERDSHATVTGHNGDCHSDSPSLDKSPQTPKINPTPSVCVGDAPARKAGQFPCPEGCDPNDWRDLLANRRSKRLPMTPAAYRKLERDLAEQADDEWPPGRILAFAAERGWAAIFDPRASNGHPRNGHQSQSNRPAQPANPMLAALAERRAS